MVHILLFVFLHQYLLKRITHYYVNIETLEIFMYLFTFYTILLKNENKKLCEKYATDSLHQRSINTFSPKDSFITSKFQHHQYTLARLDKTRMSVEVSAAAIRPSQCCKTQNNRRSANFHPDVWGNYFLSHSSNFEVIKLHFVP